MIGAAVTSLVIALGGAFFTRWFSRTHDNVSGARQRRGMWTRMVTVALVVSVFTVVVGVLWLAPSVGQEAGSWVHRATGSLEQWRESAQRAWPYLKSCLARLPVNLLTPSFTEGVTLCVLGADSALDADTALSTKL